MTTFAKRHVGLIGVALALLAAHPASTNTAARHIQDPRRANDAKR